MTDRVSHAVTRGMVREEGRVELQPVTAADGGGANQGDSGGPAFWTDAATGEQLQVGIASWTSETSVGFEHYARVDIPSAREFVDAVIADVEDDMP